MFLVPWFAGRLRTGGIARGDVTDHADDLDGSAKTIPQNCSMYRHPHGASILANTTFLNGPRLGLGVEHARQSIHVLSPIARMRQADIGFGKELLG
jgi:hypothetical protein